MKKATIRKITDSGFFVAPASRAGAFNKRNRLETRLLGGLLLRRLQGTQDNNRNCQDHS